jgi:hypothetical protein
MKKCSKCKQEITGTVNVIEEQEGEFCDTCTDVGLYGTPPTEIEYEDYYEKD